MALLSHHAPEPGHESLPEDVVKTGLAGAGALVFGSVTAAHAARLIGGRPPAPQECAFMLDPVLFERLGCAVPSDFVDICVVAAGAVGTLTFGYFALKHARRVAREL